MSREGWHFLIHHLQNTLDYIKSSYYRSKKQQDTWSSQNTAWPGKYLQTSTALATSGTSTLQSSGSSPVCRREQVEKYLLTCKVICHTLTHQHLLQGYSRLCSKCGISVFPTKETLKAGGSHKVLSNVRGRRPGLSEISLAAIRWKSRSKFLLLPGWKYQGPRENSFPTFDPWLRNKQLNHWHFLVDLRIPPTATLPNHCSTETSVFHPCSHFTGKIGHLYFTGKLTVKLK